MKTELTIINFKGEDFEVEGDAVRFTTNGNVYEVEFWKTGIRVYKSMHPVTPTIHVIPETGNVIQII